MRYPKHNASASEPSLADVDRDGERAGPIRLVAVALVAMIQILPRNMVECCRDVNGLPAGIRANSSI